MKLLRSALLCAGLLGLTAHACVDCTNNSTEPIEPAPAPWTLHGTVYSITMIPLVADLPNKAYSPLERTHASATAGKYLGILGNIQIIRYTDSPVGPYDELLIIPGYFSYEREDEDGKVQKKQHVRVSRIYVSQKYTAWNGRTNWNIPKHLARFDWTDNPDGSTTVKVYPHDTTGDPTESQPASLPWFQTTFTPSILGGLPFTTDLYKLIGINATLVQPPLPAGNGSYGELAGTDHWAATVPGQSSNKTSLGTFDLYQGEGDVVQDGVNAVGDEYFPNFWPSLPRKILGLKLENSEITFSEPELWSPLE